MWQHGTRLPATVRSSDLEGGRQLRWLTASKRRCLNHLCDLTSANDKYRNGYIRRSPGSPAIDGSFPAVDGSEAGNTLKSQWNENREEAIAGIKKAWRKHQLQKYSSLGKCISKQFQAMPSDLQKSQCSAAPVHLSISITTTGSRPIRVLAIGQINNTRDINPALLFIGKCNPSLINKGNASPGKCS